MSNLTRRELIRTGAAGVALLALVNCARSKPLVPVEDNGYRYEELSAADRALIASVGAVMLDGALPAAGAAHDEAILQVVRGVDVAISGLRPGVQAEVHQLFGLLEFPVTRGFAAGIWSSWETATPADIAKFLDGWRYSGVMLLRTGYQALHQLVMASWYGNSASWPRIGYPGPPVVR